MVDLVPKIEKFLTRVELQIEGKTNAQNQNAQNQNAQNNPVVNRPKRRSLGSEVSRHSLIKFQSSS